MLRCYKTANNLELFHVIAADLMSPLWYVPPGPFRRGDVLVDLLVASPYPPTSSQHNLIPSMVQHNGANWLLASLEANVASAQCCYKGYRFLSCGHVDEGSCWRKWEEQREKQPWCSSSRERRNGVVGGWTSSDGGDGLVGVSWGGFFLFVAFISYLILSWKMSKSSEEKALGAGRKRKLKSG